MTQQGYSRRFWSAVALFALARAGAQEAGPPLDPWDKDNQPFPVQRAVMQGCRQTHARLLEKGIVQDANSLRYIGMRQERIEEHLATPGELPSLIANYRAVDAIAMALLDAHSSDPSVRLHAIAVTSYPVATGVPGTLLVLVDARCSSAALGGRFKLHAAASRLQQSAPELVAVRLDDCASDNASGMSGEADPDGGRQGISVEAFFLFVPPRYEHE